VFYQCPNGPGVTSGESPTRLHPTPMSTDQESQPVMPGLRPRADRQRFKGSEGRSTKLQMCGTLQVSSPRRKRAERPELWEFSVGLKAESSDDLFILAWK